MNLIPPMRRRPFLVRSLIYVLFNLFFLGWLLLKPFSGHLSDVSDDLLSGVSYLLGTCFCFGHSGRPRQSHLSSQRRWPDIQSAQFLVPMFLTLGLSCTTLGIFLYTYYDFSQQIPFPSLADAAFLCASPPLLLAILLLPTRPLSATMRSRTLFDSLMIMASVITFSWYFILGPTILQGSTSLLGQIVAAAYIVGDLLTVVCLLMLSFRSNNPALRPGLLLLALAFLLLVISDSIYSYQSLNNTFKVGLSIYAYSLGYMLIGLATYALRTSTAWDHTSTRKEAAEPGTQREIQQAPLSRWLAYLPYLLIPAVIVLVIFIWQQGTQGPLEQGVFIGSAFLLALLLIRQILVLRQTDDYAQQMRQLNDRVFEANVHLERLATTDPLTELPNHRALLATLTREQERAQRYQHPYSLLFFDLDHFKALNDSYGHAAGDMALCEFGQLLVRNMRDIDTVGRWGGEEFIAVLPETESGEAQRIAERLRAAVSLQPFAVGGSLYLTCSIGIACYPAHAQTLESIVNAADQAMYAAKRLGRNQVRAIDDPAVRLLFASETSEQSREETMLHGFVDALCSLIEERDPSLGDHCIGVAHLAQQLAIHLGIAVQEAQMVYLVGQLHDLGKISIPDVILQKPSRLTPEEWEHMKKHVSVGAEILAHIPSLHSLAPIVRAHHERWDGTGYPDQLKGEEIPFVSRLISVVDTYMAIITDRPYQQARTSEQALAEVERCAGTQFDPAIARAFSELLARNAQKASAFPTSALLSERLIEVE